VSNSDASSANDPTPLTESLDAVLRALAGPGRQAMRGIFDAWPDNVGPQTAAHAKPMVLDRGRLVIEVDQPGWATQLRYLEQELISKLTPFLAGAELTGIDVRIVRQSPGSEGRRW
jgi:predicted nucleic acid-binding Zn ribbon protein